MKAFFYVGVMLPMWTSYLVKVYAWRLLLAKEGILAWLLGKLGLSGVAGGRARDARHRRAVAVVVVPRHVHRVRLHVAAVHDPAAWRPRWSACRTRCCRRRRISARGRRRRSATWCCRWRCPARRGLGVHVLADARRLHHPERRRRAGLLHRHDGVRAAGHGRQHSAGRGVLGRADRADLRSIYRIAKRFGAFDAL